MHTETRTPAGWPALWALLALLGASALLAGCGDSRYHDAEAPAPPPAAAENDLPPEALASVEGLVQWARALATRDDSEPLRVQGAQLPVSDTAEPLPLDGDA